MVHLFHHIRTRGLKVFVLSSRAECLREATVGNLINVGYHGWTELILRSVYSCCLLGISSPLLCYLSTCSAEKYKAAEREKMVKEGYRLWGIVGSQWSSLGGYTTARRIFKLPNPLYYEY
ncbi:hypothetical protein BHE74_00058457 [Ensete ventricosum]|nr:hypothetical protein GW17_00006106 [Ensete ventricosum]RWW36511.1 hypothetical protein BHE74_00058457 [Ensete ventricosum]